LRVFDEADEVVPGDEVVADGYFGVTCESDFGDDPYSREPCQADEQSADEKRDAY